jgi:hypothetical protein
MGALGHNNPPSLIDEALAPYGDFISEAENWLDGSKVENEGQMKAVDAVLKEIKSAERAIKDAEESAAKPIYDQWKAEKAKFTPTLTDLNALKKGLAALVNDFKKKLAAEKAEAERNARVEADRLRREAEDAARNADVANIEAQRKAAAKLAQAQDAAKMAQAASKDTVKGLRTVTKYEITDHRALLNWIAKNDRDAITAFIEEYARKEHKIIPKADGILVWQEKEAF